MRDSRACSRGHRHSTAAPSGPLASVRTAFSAAVNYGKFHLKFLVISNHGDYIPPPPTHPPRQIPDQRRSRDRDRYPKAPSLCPSPIPTATPPHTHTIHQKTTKRGNNITGAPRIACVTKTMRPVHDGTADGLRLLWLPVKPEHRSHRRLVAERERRRQ